MRRYLFLFLALALIVLATSFCTKVEEIKLKEDLFTEDLDFRAPNIENTVYLYGQTGVNNFLVDYGHWFVNGNLKANLWITDAFEEPVFNLNALSVITKIEGYVIVAYTSALQNFYGLHNVKKIEGGFYAYYNEELFTLKGLEQLNRVGGEFSVFNNDMLFAAYGTGALSSIAGDLKFSTNPNMKDMRGFGNLKYIGGDFFITYNTSLTSLDGFSKLKTIAGDELKIIVNSALTDCCEIYPFLTAGQFTTITIFDNGTGCSSIEDILDSCPYVKK